MPDWKNKSAQGKQNSLSAALDTMSQAYSREPNQLCYSCTYKKNGSVWKDWIAVSLEGPYGGTQTKYPLICPFAHPARHRSLTGCCSRWQTYWRAREELGIIGGHKFLSGRCGEAYSPSTGWTHLCGMHGIHVAAPIRRKKALSWKPVQPLAPVDMRSRCFIFQSRSGQR